MIINKALFGLILILLSTSAFSQSNWISKELGNKIYIKFPNLPTYKLTDKIGSYTSKTDKCIFIGAVNYDVVPHYGEFVKLNLTEQKKLIEILLDNTVKGMLLQASNEGVPYIKIKVGDNSGREVEYSFINPATGNRTLNHAKLFYLLNKIFILQTFSYKDDATCEEDKGTFLNSITTR